MSHPPRRKPVAKKPAGTTTVNISDGLAQKVRILAAEAGRSRSAQIEHMLAKSVDAAMKAMLDRQAAKLDGDRPAD